MASCSRLNCSEKAKFECICRSERKYYCQADLITHLGDSSTVHTTKALENQDKAQVQREVLKALTKITCKIKEEKKKILCDFSRMISQLEERGRTVSRNMSDYEKSLEKAINDIKVNSDSIPDSNLKKTLSMGLEEAKTECLKWDLISISLNSNEMKTMIEEWATVVSDIDYLFTNKTDIKSSQQKKFNSEYPTFIPQKERVIERTNSGIVNQENTPRASVRPMPPVNPNLPQTPETKISRDVVLRCKTNHELRWMITVPFIYYKKSKSFWIKCDNCSRTFSSSCWHCDNCNYDLCEACGLNKGVSSLKLKCGNNHELLWRPEANMFYEFKGQGHNFSCKSCREVKNETHWHCRQCEYDICQKCGSEKGQAPLSSGSKCNNSHPLIKSSIRTANVGGLLLIPKCKCCQKNFEGECYLCQQCNYIICPDCNTFYNYPAAGHPVFRCQASHLLRWNPTGNFQCDYCYGKMTQERYRCKECNFDVCMKCADILLCVVIKSEQKTHGPNNHPLIWIGDTSQRNGGNPITCNMCGLNFKKAGMFGCNNCQNNYCLLCYNDPNRPKPNPQALAGGDALSNLIALQLLGGLLRGGN